MQHRGRWIVVVLIIAGLQLSACAQPSARAVGKTQPARLEPIAGTEVKRVLLTEKAAERIGIETAPVRDEQVTRTRSVGGEVLAPGGSGVPDLGGTLVWVRLNPSDADKVDRSQPALVVPLAAADAEASQRTVANSPSKQENGDALSSGWTAKPVEVLSTPDPKGTVVTLHYVVDSAEHSLKPGQRVFVELTLSGSEMPRKVVPYSAVIYDVQGGTWTYTSPEPLVFVRQRVSVDFIDDDLAVLVDGPPAGTMVVTAGATELFGTERLGK